MDQVPRPFPSGLMSERKGDGGSKTLERAKEGRGCEKDELWDIKRDGGEEDG